MNQPFSALVAAMGLLFLAQPASGSVMLPMSLSELTRSSDVVARGKVVRTESRLSSDGRRIFTVVTFEVTDAWKGSPGAKVELQVPGGSYDGIAQVVTGAPVFAPGEEAVVFMRDFVRSKDRAEASARVVGMAQGKLQVRSDPAGNPVAVQQLEGLELVDPRSREPVAPPLREPISLPSLEAQVRDVSR